MMAAAILARGPVELQRVPQLADVHTLALVLEDLGLATSRTGDAAAAGDSRSRADPRRYRLVRRMRASFCVLGPLLARRGRAIVPLPGGCNIGHRPVDLHLKGLAALGADLRLERGYVVARARRLVGRDDRSGRAARADGHRHGQHPQRRGAGPRHHDDPRGRPEPEIVDLGNFLNCDGGADRRAGHLNHRSRRAWTAGRRQATA